MAGAKAMQEFEPNWIIAMGGGSSIDAAKAMWFSMNILKLALKTCSFPLVFLNWDKNKICCNFFHIWNSNRITALSVITDYEKGIKYPLADFEITPDIAIVDPDVAETIPPRLTANTGMDALTHAFEVLLPLVIACLQTNWH